MSWYKALVAHDRMRRGNIYHLEDTAYVAVKVERGLLEPADEPEWHRNLPDDRRLEDK